MPLENSAAEENLTGLTELQLMQKLRYCTLRVQEYQQRAKALADEMNRRVDIANAAEQPKPEIDG